jgi:hypothetical protein
MKGRKVIKQRIKEKKKKANNLATEKAQEEDRKLKETH